MFSKRHAIDSIFRRCALSLALLTAFTSSALYAQTSPCAPDASGDFKPTADVTCQLPESGEFSYRDVVIPSGVEVRFQRNSRNTPVTIRASGNVTITGAFVVRGTAANGRLGGKGGPGGFDGGKGGISVAGESPLGTAGDGPGGGLGGRTAGTAYGYGGGGGFARPGKIESDANSGAGGNAYGTSALLPLIGGSGGGGGAAGPQGVAGGGGGGGGAILIFCGGTIRFTKPSSTLPLYGIFAEGGGSDATTGNAHVGGGGSGGAIRLVAATAIIGAPELNAAGGNASFASNDGGEGYIRIESRDLTQFNPVTTSTIVTSLTPGPATLTNAPQLKIQTVGGQAAPTTPAGSFYQQPDITVPTSVTNPVTVVVQGTNLPAGTAVQLTLNRESGEKETKTCALSNAAPASCNVTLTLPTTGVAVITASAILDVLVALGHPLTIEGERVDKVEIAAAFGGASQLTYITKSGRRLLAP